MANLNRITEELRRLEREEELAEELILERRRKQEEQMRKAQREMDEAFNRLLRLRRMKRQLRERGVEMARRNLDSVEALEEADREEEEARRQELERVQQQESEAVRNAQDWGALDTLDWEAIARDAGLDASAVVGSVRESCDPV